MLEWACPSELGTVPEKFTKWGTVLAWGCWAKDDRLMATARKIKAVRRANSVVAKTFMAFSRPNSWTHTFDSHLGWKLLGLSKLPPHLGRSYVTPVGRL